VYVLHFENTEHVLTFCIAGFAVWFDASGLNYLGLFDPATGGIGTVDVFPNQGALLFGDITA
jgi:streptogramin lyase